METGAEHIEYKVTRYISKPLRKKVYHPWEIYDRNGIPMAFLDDEAENDDFARKAADALSRRKLQEKTENKNDRYFSVEEEIRKKEEHDASQFNRVLDSVDAGNEENGFTIEEIADEEPEKGRRFFLFKRKAKSRKDPESAEGKEGFSIWEDIPDEPRDTGQLEAAEIINKDGYYDTLQPIDAGQEHLQNRNLDWKIPVLIMTCIALIIFFVVFVTNYDWNI